MQTNNSKNNKITLQFTKTIISKLTSELTKISPTQAIIVTPPGTTLEKANATFTENAVITLIIVGVKVSRMEIISSRSLQSTNFLI